MAFDAEMKEHNRRESRIVAQLSTMSALQKEKLNEIKHALEMSLCRVYGVRLKPDFRDRVIHECVLDPRVLCTVAGGMNEMPTTANGWDSLAKEMAESDPLVMLNVTHSDEELKTSLRKDALEQIPSKDRMNMARVGTLDSHLDQIVEIELEKRLGL